MNDDICTNCGHWKGLHHFETNQCPAGGEAPVGRKQNWLMSIYQAPDKRDATIAAQAATIVQLREALENVYNVGMQGIGYVGAANYPERERKAFDDLQKAMDAARALKGGE